MSTFKILVIDDDPTLLELVRELLPSEVWTVITVVSGPEGIERARAEQPHLILIDCHMPGLDGPAAVARLKADPVTRRIPVLAMTASPDVQALMDAGCVGYIPKPFDVRSFSALVGRFARETAGRHSELWPR